VTNLVVIVNEADIITVNRSDTSSNGHIEFPISLRIEPHMVTLQTYNVKVKI